MSKATDELREALAGAASIMQIYFEDQGRDPSNNDNYCRVMDALAQLNQSPDGGWRSVESAPHYPEGATPVLVYGAKRLEWAVAYRDVDDSWLVETCSDTINIYPPTHWRPLPPPPATEPQGEGEDK